MGAPEVSLWSCPWGRKTLGHYVGGEAGTEPFPQYLPAPVAEKTKEQASHLGGAVFSGAGNIAAATGLVKKEEFPTDLKASDSPSTCRACWAHMPAIIHLYSTRLGHRLACLLSYKTGLHWAQNEAVGRCA